MERSWSVDRVDGITLVRCRVRNDRSVPRRVRIESRLDGPVLPPRRRGVPENGWDESGVTLRLEPGERRALGFASPAEPTDPPVTVSETEPTTEDREADACEAVRRLETHRPPADVVERIGGAFGMDDDDEGDDSGDSDDESDDSGDDDDESDGTTGSEGGTTSEEPHGPEGSCGPERVNEWLGRIEKRIERGERLTNPDLETATEALVETGGLTALADLNDRLEVDAEQLQQISDRAATLAERADAVDVPIDAMEELA
ncbi:DUF7857 domain-containing protein [Halorubrum vacuolatum]|uniref:DUF8080 domain-containing protein n=1 Tax=Halorubrum vacuolatum TaxID=63740 RepID=A0A238WRM7_HALVU|nr:hypothetical protein [Halorubrum vacuolatum]SNR49051.1 hypothetical protein SAMN06264855_109106 [Halorubrum vacuolatum]